MGHYFHANASLGLLLDEDDFTTFLERYNQHNGTTYSYTEEPPQGWYSTPFRTFRGDREFEIDDIPSDIETFDFCPFLKNGIPNLNNLFDEYRYLSDFEYFWIRYPDFSPLSVSGYLNNFPSFESIAAYYQDLLEGYLSPQTILARLGLIAYACIY